MPNVFAGKIIAEPLIWAKEHTALVQTLLEEHGPTHVVNTKLREAGIDPDAFQVSTLIRVFNLNGDEIENSHIVTLACSLANFCVQGIMRGSEVMYLAEGTYPWREPNPARGFRGDRKMKNGDPIHNVKGYVWDTLVIDTEAAPQVLELKTRKPAKTNGFASHVKTVAKMLADELLKKPVSK